MPTFFFSYARQNRLGRGDSSPWLDLFYEDLCGEVATLMGLDPATVGFRDLDQPDGTGWSATIGAALGEAAVFVPVYSPHYFLREMCGREWHGFARRSAGPTPAGIVPVWWVPVGDGERPAVAEAIQDHRSRYDARFRRLGLLVYQRNKQFEGEYWTIVRDLAESIKQAAATPPPTVAGTDLTDEPPAFPAPSPTAPAPAPPRTRESRRATFVVAAENSETMTALRAGTEMYGRDFRDWRPYHPQSDQEVTLIVQTVAGGLRLVAVDAAADRTLLQLVTQAEENHEPLILILDPWVAELPGYQALMDDFNRRRTANAAVIMPPGGDDPGAGAAEQRARGLLHFWAGDGSWFREGPGTVEEFSVELGRLLVEVKGRIMRAAQLRQSALPPGPRSRPTLGGPGS